MQSIATSRHPTAAPVVPSEYRIHVRVSTRPHGDVARLPGVCSAVSSPAAPSLRFDRSSLELCARHGLRTGAVIVSTGSVVDDVTSRSVVRESARTPVSWATTPIYDPRYVRSPAQGPQTPCLPVASLAATRAHGLVYRPCKFDVRASQFARACHCHCYCTSISSMQVLRCATMCKSGSR